MFPFDEFISETSAADLLEQVRWRDGRQCPRCRSESVIKYGSYRAFQRYRCKDCDRTFNDKTGTIFAHAKIALTEWFFAIYGFLRFNMSIRQLEAELDVSYRTLRQRIERFARALNAPSLSLSGPVEIDEVYVTAGKKGRERDHPSARVACPRAGEDRTTETSHRCSSSLTAERANGTSSQRNPQTSRRCDSSSRPARRSR